MKFSTLEKVIKDKKGLLLIDKSQDWTSHDVVAKLRRVTKVKKIGHAGTLDPLATGLLIILVGREFTKRQTEFLKQDKEYECEAQLGTVTDSYDRMGQEVDRASWDELKKIERQDLEKILPKFTGKISQTVPAFSAVKVKGQKLYNQARKGEVDLKTLPVREVEIYDLELLEFEKDLTAQKITFKIKTKVSSGTYIRSMIHDIGEALGVGAMVTELRRTKIGEIAVDGAENLS
jgi:tRNA pseudouridine55 synthase